MRHFIWLALFGISLSAVDVFAEDPGESKPNELVTWSALPDLPDAYGLAGPFVGVHDGVLIVAGGANFPDGVPWHPAAEGYNSPKRYYSKVHVLASGSEGYRWLEGKGALPQIIGYGVSVSTPMGVVCIGGEWQTHQKDEDNRKWVGTKSLSQDVYVLQWHGDEVLVKKKLVSAKTNRNGTAVEDPAKFHNLPPLPVATTAMAGALVGNTIYVVGGDIGEGATKNVWALNLNERKVRVDDKGQPLPGDKWQWKSMPPIPGAQRTHCIAVAQNDGRENCLFVFSGRYVEDGQFHLLRDAYKFSPGEGEWTDLGEIKVGDGPPRCVMAGTGIQAGNQHILIIGGASGDVLMRNEQELPALIADAKANGDDELVAKLTKDKFDLYDKHNGFSRDILSYHTVTNRWVKADGLFPETKTPVTGPDAGDGKDTPKGSHVTTTAVKFGGGIVIPTGEVSPGVRTKKVWLGTIGRDDVSFGMTNWYVLGGYLGLLVLMGLYFSTREKSSSDFFLGGRRVPWWAAGLSIFATMLSAITYLSIPARAFGTDWSYFIINMGIPIIAPVVIFLYLPFYRRLNITSAYEYLERRFSLGIRLIGSASFVLFQLARMGIVILLPAWALSAVTGLDTIHCVILMGVLSTIYTVLGGIEAVIWTDVIQVFVLVGGAIAALVIMAQQFGDTFGAGMSEIYRIGMEQGKMDFVRNWHSHDLSWARDGILVVIIGAIFNTLLPYTADQAVVQRYLTTNNESRARMAIWTNAVLAVFASVLFFGVGTALYVFYQANPGSLLPIDKPDQIFPWFISNEMPAGLSGLVIAGVFAAAMSSLDSSMHSIATAVTTDFYQRFNPQKTEKQLLGVARWLTVLLGVAGTVSALVIAELDVKYLWDTFMAYVGLLLGTLGGLFTLGIFTRRSTSVHAWLGLIAAAAALWWARTSGLHGLLNGAIALVTCLTVGIVSSWLLPIGVRRIGGLTIFTMRVEGYEEPDAADEENLSIPLE